MITLQVSICDQRRAYDVKFSTEDQAIAYADKLHAQDKAAGYEWGNHVFEETREHPIPDECTKLHAFLYPTCEHGMSADFCYGPDHFMSADQERAMDWQYND